MDSVDGAKRRFDEAIEANWGKKQQPLHSVLTPEEGDRMRAMDYTLDKYERYIQENYGDKTAPAEEHTDDGVDVLAKAHAAFNDAIKAAFHGDRSDGEQDDGNLERAFLVAANAHFQRVPELDNVDED